MSPNFRDEHKKMFCHHLVFNLDGWIYKKIVEHNILRAHEIGAFSFHVDVKSQKKVEGGHIRFGRFWWIG